MFPANDKSRLGIEDYIEFESEPEWVNPEGWYYGVRFSHSNNGECLRLKVAQDEGELEVIWTRGERKLLHFVSVALDESIVERSGENAVLLLRYGDTRLEHVRLSLRPSINVEWQMVWAK